MLLLFSLTSFGCAGPKSGPKSKALVQPSEKIKEKAKPRKKVKVERNTGLILFVCTQKDREGRKGQCYASSGAQEVDPIVEWEWDWGDGSKTTTAQNMVSHEWSTPPGYVTVIGTTRSGRRLAQGKFLEFKKITTSRYFLDERIHGLPSDVRGEMAFYLNRCAKFPLKDNKVIIYKDELKDEFKEKYKGFAQELIPIEAYKIHDRQLFKTEGFFVSDVNMEPGPHTYTPDFQIHHCLGSVLLEIIWELPESNDWVLSVWSKPARYLHALQGSSSLVIDGKPKVKFENFPSGEITFRLESEHRKDDVFTYIIPSQGIKRLRLYLPSKKFKVFTE